MGEFFLAAHPPAAHRDWPAAKNIIVPRTIPCLVLTTASICVYLSIPDQRTRDRNRVGGNMSNQELYSKYTILDKVQVVPRIVAGSGVLCLAGATLIAETSYHLEVVSGIASIINTNAKRMARW